VGQTAVNADAEVVGPDLWAARLLNGDTEEGFELNSTENQGNPERIPLLKVESFFSKSKFSYSTSHFSQQPSITNKNQNNSP